MKGNRAVLTAVVIVVVLAAGLWFFRRSGPTSAIQLIDRFADAKKQPDDPALYSIVDASLNGETKRSSLRSRRCRISVNRSVKRRPNRQAESTIALPLRFWIKRRRSRCR